MLGLGNAITLGFTPQYGPELAVGWNTSAWWDVFDAGWSADEGVSMSCDGTNNADAKKAPFWDITKTYKIEVSVTVNSGGLFGLYDGTNQNSYAQITVTGDYVDNAYNPAASTTGQFFSNSFNGTVTALSVKEIL